MKPAGRVGDRLRQIRDAVTAIERLTEGKTLAEYVGDPDLVAAVEAMIGGLKE